MAYEIDLGPWGIELDDESFGCALAAVGIVLGAVPELKVTLETELPKVADPAYLHSLVDSRHPIPWRLGPILYRSPEEWAALARQFEAAEAAKAWREAVGQRLPEDVVRLQIEPFSDEIGPYHWLADQLMQPGVFASAFVASFELASEHHWQWPLRVGFLDDPESITWRDRLEEQPWSSPLFRKVSAEDRGVVDLLLLPQALPRALSRLMLVKQRLDVGCVVVLGGLAGEAEQRAHGLFASLQMRTRPWGVAVTSVDAAAADKWFSGLMYVLAHDTTLDVALRAAGHSGVLFADPDLLQEARVMVTAARLVEALPRAAAEPDSVELPPEAARVFNLPTVVPRRDVAAAASRREFFMRETDGGAATAAMAEHVHATRAEALVRAELRWIQVLVYEGTGAERQERRQALRPNTVHSMDVWVGPEGKGIHGKAPFPDEALPQDRSKHRLKVVFAELDGSGRTSTGTIELPPVGKSGQHQFHFRTGSAGTFRARLIVLYRNRILQTAVVRAPVVDPSHLGADDQIRLDIEAVVRPGLAELAGRRPFGVALVHNHDEHGVESGTAMAGDRAVSLALGNLRPTVDTIVAELSAVADSPDAFGPKLDAAATVDLLFKLANQGVLLRDGLLAGRPRLAALIRDADRIQILSADPNAILPLEFVYDFPVPSAPTLCRNAKRALQDGHCDPRHHPLARDGSTSVVCPVGFWGMTRVIERHVANPERFETDLRGLDYELDAEPARDRDRLAGLQGAIFAASHEVEVSRKGATRMVEKALANATGGRSKRIKTWDDWVAAVDADRPSLLVLLAHTVRDELAAQTALEIEKVERRPAVRINSRYVRASGVVPPLVFLLGCDTAVADMQYQTFVTRFREVGAALVVGTVATVAGKHAASVAKRLATALKEASAPRWTAFGDLLRDARRSLLANGEVMALCLTAYGDADWRFPGGGE